jgi:hypothetical protein
MLDYFCRRYDKEIASGLAKLSFNDDFNQMVLSIPKKNRRVIKSLIRLTQQQNSDMTLYLDLKKIIDVIEKVMRLDGVVFTPEEEKAMTKFIVLTKAFLERQRQRISVFEKGNHEMAL